MLVTIGRKLAGGQTYTDTQRICLVGTPARKSTLASMPFPPCTGFAGAQHTFSLGFGYWVGVGRHIYIYRLHKYGHSQRFHRLGQHVEASLTKHQAGGGVKHLSHVGRRRPVLESRHRYLPGRQCPRNRCRRRRTSCRPWQRKRRTSRPTSSDPP